MPPSPRKAFFAFTVMALAGCGGKSPAGHGPGDAAADHQGPGTGDAQVETAPGEPDGGSRDGTSDGALDASSDASSDAPVDAAAEGQADASLPDADGRDALPEVAARRPYRALALASGRYHMCALLDDHKVKCWGDNGSGQLGLGDKVFRGANAADMGDALPTVDLGAGRTAKAIAAGRYASCAILDTDALKCWGMRQLNGTSIDNDLGDEPGEMGDALPAVDLGAGRTARQVAVGFYEACVQRDDGTLRCWSGTSSTNVTVDGQVKSLTGGSSVLALFNDGSVASIGVGTVAPVARLPLARPARAVATSGGVSKWCAVLDDGSLQCSASGPAYVAPPAATKVTLVALTERGDLTALMPDETVRTWRTSSAVFPWIQAPASDPSGGFTAALGQPAQTIVGGGFDHECALLANGSVKCWSRAPGSKEPALGTGPDNGISGTTWRAIDLGTHE